MNEALKKIGIVSDAHGIRGELYVVVFSGDISWIESLKHIFVQKDKAKEPKKLVIKKAKPFKKGFIAAIDGMTNRNQAEEIKKFEVLVESDIFVSEDGEQPYLSELLDFEITDKNLGRVGKVVAFSSNGNQDLLVLDRIVNTEPTEIPFVEDFIIEVDYKAKHIKTELPEGLIDINEKD